jgi:hypothetical protein
MKLTDIVLRNLPVPEEGQKTCQDDSLPGFGVRVSPGGTKTFVVVYGYRRDRRTIGRYPVISLADARTEAKRLLAEVTLGKPRLKRIPFEAALDAFVANHCAQKNRPRMARDTERLIRDHFAPKLARGSLDEITARDISSVTDRLPGAGKPGAANHAFTAVRTFPRLLGGGKGRFVPSYPGRFHGPPAVACRDRAFPGGRGASSMRDQASSEAMKSSISTTASRVAAGGGATIGAVVSRCQMAAPITVSITVNRACRSIGLLT